ncbi:3-dehydroquinate dehydratase I [Thermotomaculum hydrothermale]|uniref:3-dehydroquinate dehydratase n=1 Tax=Thermotomaculum hydrothermale TaxID=981385 RepID=A0A7R6PEM8_9BACT|nr:type I 3-dehydroquinate dehydratase [Thermotomaculum hydrothermale]BBB32314.1 3-dehydroquinate dehydratase I [Thermotomaculum hydrothermale]
MDFKICVSITESNIDKVKKILKQFNFCELRLDLIKPEISQIEELLAVNRNVIVTCRENQEIDRVSYLKEAIKFQPEYIDIEFETEESVKKELINLCERFGVKRIHSYHNFNETPDYVFLKNIAEKEFERFSPSLIKIATYVKKESDNITLLSLLSLDIPLIVLGMGDYGKKTRLFAPLFGSKITFACVNNKPSAPGQIDYYKMKEFYNILENYSL